MSYEIRQRGNGFAVHRSSDGEAVTEGEIPALHAASVAHLLNVAEPLQEGDGLRSALMNLAGTVLKHASKPLLGHAAKVAKLFQRKRINAAGQPHRVAPEDQRAAAAASDVYKPVNERKLRGLIPELSNDEIAVYASEGNQPALVALRGSANLDDAKTDGHLALGRLRKTDRWKRTAAHLDHVRNTLGNNFDLTGHSLAGSLALEYARDHPELRTIAYNPGASIPDVIGAARTLPDNARVYSSAGDVVSALSSARVGDVRITEPKVPGDALQAHFMHNFL